MWRGPRLPMLDPRCMEAMQRGTAREMGGVSSITTILGSLLVGLTLIATNSLAVGVSGAGSLHIDVSAGGTCDRFDAQSFGLCSRSLAWDRRWRSPRHPRRT
jgi:hypothetical protein